MAKIGNVEYDKIEIVAEASIGRHGNKDGDKLIDKINEDGKTTIQRLYEDGARYHGEFIKGAGLKAENIAGIHSPLQRTRQTMYSSLAGALGVEPGPKTLSDLEKLVKTTELGKVSVEMLPDIGYEHLKINEKAFKEKGNDWYLQYWISDLNRTTMDGKEITPGQAMIGMGDYALMKIADRFLHGFRYVDLKAHGTTAEWLAIAALRAGGKDVKNVKDIGGALAEEDSFRLRVYNAVRKGEQDKVEQIWTIQRVSIKGKAVKDQPEYAFDMQKVSKDFHHRFSEGIYVPIGMERQNNELPRGHYEQQQQQQRNPGSLRPERPHEAPPLAREPVAKPA